MFVAEGRFTRGNNCTFVHAKQLDLAYNSPPKAPSPVPASATKPLMHVSNSQSSNSQPPVAKSPFVGGSNVSPFSLNSALQPPPQQHVINSNLQQQQPLRRSSSNQKTCIPQQQPLGQHGSRKIQ